MQPPPSYHTIDKNSINQEFPNNSYCFNPYAQHFPGATGTILCNPEMAGGPHRAQLVSIDQRSQIPMVNGFMIPYGPIPMINAHNKRIIAVNCRFFVLIRPVA
jgi:hypothetical protein